MGSSAEDLKGSVTPVRRARPDVSVVIPYFDDHTRLTLLLRALSQQRCNVSFDVVVADDGSPEPPTIPPGLGFVCTVVRQPDRGFRAAAARNLGAERCAGELLLFLDGDTMPASGYVQAMADRLRSIADGHGALVLGRRRHADLSSVGDDAVLAFLRDETPADAKRHLAEPADIQLLGDPEWLLDGYARTDGLRTATDEDFRLVISAVLGVDRTLWRVTGGFDESFVGYGGEDWDFGWRAWLAGARWWYEPSAVAWHDGPDAAGRGTDVSAKNAECLRLAETIPLPSVRGTGLVLEVPDIVVRYLGPVTGTAADAAAVACVSGLLAKTDAAVWFPYCAAESDLPPLLGRDPRVHGGDVPPAILARARFQVWVDNPVRLSGSLAMYCTLGEWDVPGLRIRHTRAISRGAPVPIGMSAAASLTPPAVQPIPVDVSLERWWAGW